MKKIPVLKITEKIKKGEILISDGAWGTFLHEKGLQPGDCPEHWNITKPENVYKIAKSYIDAGSDMIETNSFGGSRIKLKNYNLENETYEINKAAAEISRRAAGKDKIVLGAIGPTGKILMLGDTTEDELYDVFSEQSKALADGGADAIIIETMSDLDEARIATKAAKENTSCEIICTMTFEKTLNNDFMTMMGVSPTDMVNIIINAGADIIGANCGKGIEDMEGIIKEIRSQNNEIPLLIHANAGAPEYRDGKTVFPLSPDQFSSHLDDLIKVNTNIIGGCCGTTPKHIQTLKETLSKYKNH